MGSPDNTLLGVPECFMYSGHRIILERVASQPVLQLSAPGIPVVLTLYPDRPWSFTVSNLVVTKSMQKC